MPLPESHWPFAAIARKKHNFCSPFRLGIAVGEAGAVLDNPYRDGTHAARHYDSGVAEGLRRKRPPIDVQQVINALERQRAALIAQRDRITAAEQFDYAAEFPGEDAQRMDEAIALLRSPLRRAAELARDALSELVVTGDRIVFADALRALDEALNVRAKPDPTAGDQT